jgi:Arc/MetJ-type ribon-helix-helix transcriptional regulator
MCFQVADQSLPLAAITIVVYESCTRATLDLVSVPVTTRLDPSVVEALDRAVAAGLAPNRGSIVSAAVRSWLAEHSEEAIVASYRRRYADEDPVHDELMGQLAAFSVAACLAVNED